MVMLSTAVQNSASSSKGQISKKASELVPIRSVPNFQTTKSIPNYPLVCRLPTHSLLRKNFSPFRLVNQHERDDWFLPERRNPSSANNQFGASLPSRPNDQGQGNYLRERVIRHLRHEHRLYNFVLCFLMHLCSDLWRIKFSVCGGCNLPFPVVKRAWQLGVCLAFYVIRLFGQLALGLIAPRLRLLLPLQPCNRKDLPYFLFYYFFFYLKPQGRFISKSRD